MVAIVWTDKADEDMEKIIDYWASISENSARLQIKRIFDMVEILETFPRSGRVVPEFGHPQMREHIAGRYRIIYYIVSEARIDILAIHNSARPLDVNDFSPS
jgi:plasmid stabilization system protein ParE